jgi:hypothetical protein
MNSTTALVALAAVAVLGGIGYMVVKSQKASTQTSNAEQINAAVAAYERGAKRSGAEKIFSGAADLLGFG